MIAKKKAQENKMEMADQTKFDPKMSHECEEVEDAEQRAINESKAEHDKIVNLEKTFAGNLKSINRKINLIVQDGNCLFRSISDQLFGC